MKQRILSGWNLPRLLFVLVGGTIIVQSLMQHELAGLLPGVYFASMGIFGFGCAGGNCFTNAGEMKKDINGPTYDEIK